MLSKLIEEFDFFDQMALSSFHHDYYEKVVEYNKKNNRELVFGFLYNKSKSKQTDFDFKKKEVL